MKFWLLLGLFISLSRVPDHIWGLPWWLVLKNWQETWVLSLDQKDPLEKEIATHSSILAWEKSQGQRRLAGYSPWGLKESDTTLRLNNNNDHIWTPL